MSIIRRPYFLVAIAVCLLAAGCHCHRHAATPGPVPTPQYDAVYRTANFSCTLAGTTVSGQLRIQQDSVIWGSVVKVVELGRVKCTPDSVIIYAKILGRCFQGDYRDVHRRFGYRTSFADLQRLLTSADADIRLEALARRFNTQAVFRLEPWKEVPETSFPLSIPPHVREL